MNDQLPIEDREDTFAAECSEGILKRAELWCHHETRRVALVNEARIVALKTECVSLLTEERELEAILKHAPVPDGTRGNNLRKRFSWGVALILTLAGLAFSLIAFAPFRLGAIQYLYCTGIAILMPYLMEKLLTVWSDRKILKALVLLAALVSIASVMLLAVIRGDIVGHEMSAGNQSVVIDDAESPATPQPDFYASTLPLLRLVMALLALAMELAAGFALHDAMAQEEGALPDWETLQNRLQIIRSRLAAIAEEVVNLKNEPDIVANRFWRNFHRALVRNVTRSVGPKLLLSLIVALTALHLHAGVKDRATIVVALDLTESVSTHGPDKKTDFEKNVAAVSGLLGKVPLGSHVTVIGITDHSFAEPFILLKGRMDDDPGYFDERLKDAQNKLATAWKRRAATLTPHYPETDIVGVLLLAGQIFNESSASQKLLIILSDMRHHTRDLDLETGNSVSVPKGRIPQASLAGVEVYVLGVGGVGKSLTYWLTLEGFWREYLGKAHATVRRYSPLREIPEILK